MKCLKYLVVVVLGALILLPVLSACAPALPAERESAERR